MKELRKREHKKSSKIRRKAIGEENNSRMYERKRKGEKVEKKVNGKRKGEGY